MAKKMKKQTGSDKTDEKEVTTKTGDRRKR